MSSVARVSRRIIPSQSIPKRRTSPPTQSEIRRLFDEFSKQQNFQSLDDWYGTSSKKLSHNLLRIVTSQFSGSLTKALINIYSEHNWLSWRFEKKTQGFWSSHANQRNYFDWVGKQLGVTHLDDWYTIPATSLAKLQGEGLLISQYAGCLSKALMTVYPEHPWLFWKFERKAQLQLWKDSHQQRAFFDYLAKNHITIKSMEDWYDIPSKTVYELGGSVLMRIHDHSMFHALSAAYPEYPWKPWKFQRTHKRFWSSESNVREFLESFAQQVGITTLNDWNWVTRDQLVKFGGARLLTKYGGLVQLLSIFYPHFKWTKFPQLTKKDTRASKTQGYLYRMVQRIFPQHTVLVNFRTKIFFPTTFREIEFDIYIPDFKLAVEYQGQQHYQWSYLYGAPINQILRDDEKRRQVKREGITLLSVPFWWNKSKEAIMASISAARPDLIPFMEPPSTLESQPVDYSMPKTSYKSLKKVFAKNANQYLVQPTQVTLQELESVNLNGWWALKLPQGTRVLWAFDQLLSVPQSEIISLDNEVASTMPSFPVEAMLTGDESKPESLKLVIVDAPLHYHLGFEERRKLLENTIPKGPHIEFVEVTQWEAGMKDNSGTLVKGPSSHYLETCYVLNDSF